MSDRRPKLGPPRYKGPGKPIKVEKPAEMPHVREGRFCGRCRHFVEPSEGREHLQKTGFWDRLFHGRDDGTDIKPWMVGDPAMYSICREKEAAVHFFSTCKKWKSKDTFVRMLFGGKK